MVADSIRYSQPIHPVHAVLASSALPLFLGALLSDWAYSSSYEIQWTNFASWLIVAGLVFTGVVLVLALVDLFRADRRGARQVFYMVVLAAVGILGVVNALVHSKDAWAVMPEGLVLSAIVFALVCMATWLGFSRVRDGGMA